MSHSKSEILPEEEDKVNLICRQVLGEKWNQGNSSIKLLGGGNFNRIFHCSRGSGTAQDDAPSEVLVRFNPGKSDHCILGEAGEDLVFYVFSQHRLGPKLYGVLPGARVEQFIPSRLLNLWDFENPEMYKVLAEKVAQIHCLDVPINKDPQTLHQRLFDWAERDKDIKVNMDSFEQADRETVQRFLDMDLKAELEWVQKMIPKVKTRVVFGHNDFHQNNILLTTEGGNGNLADDLKIVDMETCGYYHRGLEFGTHFLMSHLDMSAGEIKMVGPPPDENQRKRFFIAAYLKEWQKLNSETFDPEIDTVENILLEANFFSLVRMILMLLNMKTFMTMKESHIPRKKLVEFCANFTTGFNGLKAAMAEVLKD